MRNGSWPALQATQLRKAIEAEAIRARDLTLTRRNEYRFKLGHALFENERYEEARVQLYDILNVEGNFNPPRSTTSLTSLPQWPISRGLGRI